MHALRCHDIVLISVDSVPSSKQFVFPLAGVLTGAWDYYVAAKIQRANAQAFGQVNIHALLCAHKALPNLSALGWNLAHALPCCGLRG